MEDSGTNLEERAINLNADGMSALAHGDLESAKKKFEESLKIRTGLDDRKGMSEGLFNLGYIAHEEGELKKAEKLHSESLKICEEIGDKDGMVANFSRLAVMAVDVDNLEDSYRLYDKCLNLKSEMGDKDAVLWLLHRMGTLAHNMGNTDEAIKLYKRQFDLARELDDMEALAMAMAQLHIFLLAKKKRYEGLMLLLCSHEIFLRLENDNFVQTSREIDKFKDAGYEEKVINLQNQMSAASFEGIIDTAMDALSLVEI